MFWPPLFLFGRGNGFILQTVCETGFRRLFFFCLERKSHAMRIKVKLGIEPVRQWLALSPHSRKFLTSGPFWVGVCIFLFLHSTFQKQACLEPLNCPWLEWDCIFLHNMHILFSYLPFFLLLPLQSRFCSSLFPCPCLNGTINVNSSSTCALQLTPPTL